MRQLRVRAGSPSARGIAERARAYIDVSHATVADMMGGHHVPRWHYVQAIVLALGGDAEQVNPLWQRAWEEAWRVRKAQAAATTDPEPRRPLRRVTQYRQMRVAVDEVADIYNAQAAAGWQPLHVFDAGGNTVWVVLQRLT